MMARVCSNRAEMLPSVVARVPPSSISFALPEPRVRSGSPVNTDPGTVQQAGVGSANAGYHRILEQALAHPGAPSRTWAGSSLWRTVVPSLAAARAADSCTSMQKPVGPSRTFWRPPTRGTTEMLPRCWAQKSVSPHGWKADGTRKKPLDEGGELFAHPPCAKTLRWRSIPGHPAPERDQEPARAGKETPP